MLENIRRPYTYIPEGFDVSIMAKIGVIDSVLVRFVSVELLDYKQLFV